MVNFISFTFKDHSCTSLEHRTIQYRYHKNFVSLEFPDFFAAVKIVQKTAGTFLVGRDDVSLHCSSRRHFVHWLACVWHSPGETDQLYS